jgi:3-dehydroquinate dehydratase-2
MERDQASSRGTARNLRRDADHLLIRKTGEIIRISAGPERRHKDQRFTAKTWETMMPQTIFIINGPNLNLLGIREPEIYGSETLEDVKLRCMERARVYDLDVDFRQSNFEGSLVESVHEAREKAAGIVINPAGLSFSSISLLDALKMFQGPKVEVHITNIHKRESYYHRSFISLTATGVIAGLGTDGYLFAIESISNALRASAKRLPQSSK